MKKCYKGDFWVLSGLHFLVKFSLGESVIFKGMVHAEMRRDKSVCRKHQSAFIKVDANKWIKHSGVPHSYC